MTLLDRITEFHRKHRFLSHVFYWLLVLFIAVSTSRYFDGKQNSLPFELVSDALYLTTEIIAAYGIAYFVLPQFLSRKRYVLAIAGFLLLSYLVCVLGRIIIVKICEPLAGIPPKATETYWAISTDLPKLIFVYYFPIMAVAFVFVCLKLLKDQVAIQQHSLMLEKQKAQTELMLLKTQLNPHFLFNTLNNLYSLASTASPATAPAIARLADMLDHILYKANRQWVKVEDEIGLIENYIELERLRYSSRLQIAFTRSITQTTYIPPLLLLLLVENAFKHGASEDIDTPLIDIVLAADLNKVYFRIENSVVPKEDLTATFKERIGLQNLRKQLDLIYGTTYLLNITSDDRRFTVQLTLENKNEIE